MFSPSDWGWVLQGTSLCPIRTILPPAPDKLLHVIRCKCKSGCDTRRCTCRKNGLDCSSACSECKGLNCSNCKMSGSNCVICNEPLENGQVLITIREKGAKTINEVSSKHRHQNVFVVAGQILHQECRKKYTNAKEIQKIGKENTDNDRFDRLTRSSQYFDFREHCLFCGQSAQMSDRKYGIEVYPVRTFEFQQKIDAICKDRKDSWAADVLAKLEYAQDLPAADAIYHQKCSVNFRTGKNIPIGGTPEQKRKKQGRPDHTEANTAFLKTMDYLLENEEDQLTVKDLVHQMTHLGKIRMSVYLEIILQDHIEKDNW
ncbi:unnamed protein product [Mytilus edulis]|uniref:CRC domain-containing protein n=1 Tax=Mytilus edulis TaxID=6550 RepID=A0A8S3VJJ4_MYTED|nr:unnamed protein product [Mytilus edulis]